MKAIIDGKQHIDVREAADLTGYTTEYIRRLIRLDKLEAVKQGTMWFVEMGSLEAYKQQMNHLGDEKYNPWRE